jgi:hypothetical protein
MGGGRLSRRPGRKLFVWVGGLGFFKRDIIVFMGMGGNGGRGGVNLPRKG